MADDKSLNLDPITDEPGAHPVGTGLGAVAESIKPTLEDAYWRENYHREPYYEKDLSYDDYGPAYRMGWSARNGHSGSFDEVETRLQNDWDSQRETSSLTWSQARAASLAAWNRASYQTQGSDGTQGAWADTIAPSQHADNDEVVDTLNDLLESCRDGEYGFTTAAENAQSAPLKSLLMRHAGECKAAAIELQGLIHQLGGEAEQGGSMTGALHRGWVSVRGTLSAYSDQAMLDECERGEDSAVASYRKALRTNLPVNVRSVVERQSQGAQRNHDEVKAMRDALR